LPCSRASGVCGHRGRQAGAAGRGRGPWVLVLEALFLSVISEYPDARHSLLYGGVGVSSAVLLPIAA
jgi:hypothetical protein